VRWYGRTDRSARLDEAVLNDLRERQRRRCTLSLTQIRGSARKVEIAADHHAQVPDRLATQIGLEHSSDLQGRRARCRRARSWATPSMHSWFGQFSEPQGNPARCRSACRRREASGSCAGAFAAAVAGMAASACRAVTQTATGQLLLPHGSPLACSCACASALRRALARRRRSRSGAQISQPRFLQIRPREWAIACSCSGVGGGPSVTAFVERLGFSLVGARGTGC
jgi:hypothetical protein